MSHHISTTTYDHIIKNEDVAAIVMRQHLKPVEGDPPAVIFPPTYANIGYNIDTFDQEGDFKNVCVIDSVGSQANRMEPLFKNPPYSDLVPKIKVEVRKPARKGEDKGELIDEIDLLDAGHRIADAVVRFSDAADDIREAFDASKKGDATPLAKLAPTSLVFGCWDSRDSYVKLPRIVRSKIEAYNVFKLTRSAVYIPATQRYEETFETLSEKEKKKFADTGMAHVPSSQAPGGVLLDSKSKLIKNAVVSLSALRALRAKSDDEAAILRRYIFGLALVAITAPQEPLLRMGCELTADPEKPAKWELVNCDGARKDFSVSHQESLEFAKAVAQEFVVGGARTFVFDSKKANKALKKTENKKEK